MDRKLIANVRAAIALGYDVGFAVKAGDVYVFHIEGHGITLYLRDDDVDGWASVLDRDAHAERALQHVERSEGKTYGEILARQEAG